MTGANAFVTLAGVEPIQKPNLVAPAMPEPPPGSERCVRLPDLRAIVTVGDSTIRTITANGHTWRFEFSQRFGPTVVGKRDQIIETRAPKAFYEAVSLWGEQGYRMADRGVCVYIPPVPMKLLKLRGRHYCEDMPANRKHFAKWLESVDPDRPPETTIPD